jgi:thiosulfate reductase cytochrome b subunit
VSDQSEQVLPGQEPFETNKTLSIIAIVVGAVTCGCLTLIFGILGLVFANKAQNLWNAGDVSGANSAASNARIFAIIGFVLAAIWLVFFIISLATGAFSFGWN